MPDNALVYVALGDSAAQAVGASRPENGYVGSIAELLAKQSGRTVRVVNLSVSGAKVADALATQIPQLKSYKADVVTIEIGANDIRRFDADAFERDFSLLVAQLPAGTVVGDMPYFGGRASGDNGKATQATAIVRRLVAERNLILAPLSETTNGANTFLDYSADFFHPNDKGYRNWTRAFWTAINKR